MYKNNIFREQCCQCFQDLLVTLSTLLRGSIYEKLRWTFKLYDINGDGCITRGELGEVVTAVHELMGRKHPADEARQAREQLDRVFEKLDLNHDGVITIEEFIESCLKVSYWAFMIILFTYFFFISWAFKNTGLLCCEVVNRDKCIFIEIFNCNVNGYLAAENHSCFIIKTKLIFKALISFLHLTASI